MDWKKKLTSRKLWLAVIGAGAGIAIALGADNSLVQQIAGAATSLISVIAYIVTEGKIDAAAVDATSDLAKQVLEIVEALKKE